MMDQIQNTESRYGLVSIFLHWAMAIMIFALLALGFYMMSLPDVGFNSNKIILIFVHKELGILVLFLVIIRFIWRYCNIVPLLPDSLPAWQKLAARTVHLSFYGFMFALPITGWLMSSAANIPLYFLGVFELPYLITSNINQMQFYIDLHKWLAYGLIASICAHVGAALLHHFFYKDDTLRKMLP